MAVNCAADIRRVSERPTLLADVKQAGDVARVPRAASAIHASPTCWIKLAWSDRELATRFVTEHDCGLHVLAASEGFGRPNCP